MNRYIPTARNRKFKKAGDEIQTRLKKIIKKRKAEIEAGEATKTDLLGVLLSSNMSLQEVINECKLFYFGGQETTSLLLVWTLLLLSKHQDWQARAREEVLLTFGNSAPDFEGLAHLKTVS